MTLNQPKEFVVKKWLLSDEDRGSDSTIASNLRETGKPHSDGVVTLDEARTFLQAEGIALETLRTRRGRRDATARYPLARIDEMIAYV